MKNQTEEHDHENILQSLQVDNEDYKKKYKSLYKKKVFFINTEVLIGSDSTVGSRTLAILNPIAGIVFSSSTALLTSIGILITDENISKLKLQ